MQTAIASALSVLPVVLLFATGLLLQTVRFFPEGSVSSLRRLVSDVALPALLFKAFASIELDGSLLVLVLVIFVSCIAMLVLGTWTGRLLGMRTAYHAFMMGGFEMGMLGYALFLALFGQEHMGKIALVDLGQVVFVFFVLMALLVRQRDGMQRPSDLVKRFATSPVVVAILLGIVASFIAPGMPSSPVLESLSEFVDMVASLTVPLIAITIGYGISFKREGLALSVKTIAVRRLLLLFLALGVNALVVDRLLGLDPMYRKAVLVMFMTPPPFVISIYVAAGDKRNVDYVANTLSLDTLVSVLLVVPVVSVFG